MDAKAKANLEAAGYTFGDYGDFLDLTPPERERIELETALVRVIRAAREKAGVTQAELARRIGSSQSRVAKIESGLDGVTLDLGFKALFELGKGIADVAAELKRGRKPTAATKAASKAVA